MPLIFEREYHRLLKLIDYENRLEDLLPIQQYHKLEEVGYGTVRDLQGVTDRKLFSIPRIGARSVRIIDELLKEDGFKGVERVTERRW